MDVEANSKSSVKKDRTANATTPENIKSEIESTRAEMGDAAHELGRRLQPSRIVGDFVDSSPTLQFVKRHPVSLSLLGLGVAIYFMEKRKPVFTNLNPKAAKESLAEGVEYVKERVHTGVDAAKTTLGHARESLAHTSERAREMASHGLERSAQMYDNNPMMFGALALAAGVGLGMAMPSTEPEQRMMGDSARGFIDKAKHQIQEATQTVTADVKDYVNTAAHLG